MKKLILVFVIVCGALAPFACTRPSPMPVSPQPTPITTPVCAMTPLSLIPSVLTVTVTLVPVYTATPTPTPQGVSASPTPSPIYISGTPLPAPPFASSTPSVSYPNSPFGGTVLRTTADWQAFYGTVPIPSDLDFNTEMVLIQSFPGCCWGTAGFANVCATSTEVEVTLSYSPWIGPDVCYAFCERLEGVIVPKSNLPIIVTTVITN